MRSCNSWVLFTVMICACGCAGPKSGKGFTLPDGDPRRGEQLFVELKCHECHSVSGIDLPDPEEARDPLVGLGGEVPRISTYGELVTSIINPSHKLAKGYAAEQTAANGQSKMRNYNDVMTVSQLIDLVAFLQSRYELMPYEPSDYPMF